MCQCEPPDCADFEVAEEDLKTWRANTGAVCYALAKSLGCYTRGETCYSAGLRMVGLVPSPSTGVYLLTQDDAHSFRGAVGALTINVRRRFVLIAPTGRFMDDLCWKFLEDRFASFLDLETHFELQQDGTIRASDEALRVVRQRAGRGQKHQKQSRSSNPDPEILSQGRLRYRPGFEDVWLGDNHYDLRGRVKARLCIQYLVEQRAFDAKSGRHLLDEIDAFVRQQGDFPPAADIKIDHYFNDRKGKLPELRKALIAASGRDGRYFLKTS